jgi:2-polyprenyl-3-methyl-5-hydroxy-6-metoxy-1,4-benzoquinol methylase
LKKKKFNFKNKKDISSINYSLDVILRFNLKHKIRDLYDALIRRPFFKFLYKNFFKKQKYLIDLTLPSKGFSDDSRKKKLNDLKGIKGKSILSIGCGNGFDVPLWLKFNPKSITAIDLLNYKTSWDKVKKYVLENNFKTDLKFEQNDILNLKPLKKYDFIVSDAVFEHLKEFDKVINFCKKILKKDGIIYASYGPLWFNYGGDHFSGRDREENGFNHILLDKKKYKKYFNRNVGSLNYEIKNKGSGGLLVKKDLFSKLIANKYMEIYKKNNLKSIFTVIEYCPQGFKLLKNNKKLEKKLFNKNSFIDFENYYLKSQIVYLRNI